MKFKQVVDEANIFGKLDSLIDKIEDFDTGSAVSTAVRSGVKKLANQEQNDNNEKINPQQQKDKEAENEKLAQEHSVLDSLYKIIKSKRPIRINGVMIDIFTAVVLMILMKNLTPMKRQIILSLPIKQLIKYAVKNIDKVFMKF